MTPLPEASAGMNTADVIVIGTGGMGSAACAQLALRGASVIGLDRFPLAHDRGSSHGQTRLIRQAYYEHPDYVPLLLEAYRLWRRLEEDTGRRLLFQSGLMMAGSPEGEAIAGTLRAADIHGLPVERLAVAEAQRRFPHFRLDDGWIAIWEAAAGYLMVEDCIRAFAAVAQSHGARFKTDVAVLGWTAGAHGVMVDTDRGTFRADRLVIAPGAGASELARLNSIPLTILKKSMFWYRPKAAVAADFAAASAAPGSTGFPCFAFDTPAGFYYGFPALDDRGVKMAEHTGGRLVRNPLTLDRTLDRNEEARVAAIARAHLPDLGTDLAYDSSCMYTMAPDGQFVIGLHPESPRVAVAAGFSGHGFKFASVVGAILADLALNGRTTQPIGFLAPDRFRSQINERSLLS